MTLHLDFNPFPTLATDRLILRQINANDKDALFEMRSNPEQMKYIPRPLAREVSDIDELLERVNTGIQNKESISWAMCLKESSKLIGTIGFVRMKKEHFRGEVGYMIHPAFQGKGLTQEALKKIIEYGFETIRFHSIEAIVDPENIASRKVCEKLSFVQEAHLKENEFYDGRFLDTVIYSIIRPLG